MPGPLQNLRSNSLANVPPLQDNNGAPVTMDPTTGTSQVKSVCGETLGAGPSELFILCIKVDGILLFAVRQFPDGSRALY